MSHIEITISPEDAADLLERLPGGRELYEELADVFLAEYWRLSDDPREYPREVFERGTSGDPHEG